MMKGKNTLLITGSTGFVGNNLNIFFSSLNYEIVNISLRDEKWKSQINNKSDAIIHLAGKAHDTSNTSNPQEYFNVNRDLTIELFNEFLISKINDFFYFSSVKAVADSVEGELNEEIEGKPITPYGKSKFQAEQYLLSEKLPEGKRLFILRPCMIHGPGNKGNLNLLYNVVNKGIPWPLAAFENRRSFMSIDNLNFIIKSILDSPDIENGIYNLADDESLSTNELIALISEVSRKKARFWNISKTFIRGVARAGDKLRLPLNSERLKKLTESYVVDNKKLKSALKIDHLPVSTKEGLILTLKGFDNQN